MSINRKPTWRHPTQSDLLNTRFHRFTITASSFFSNGGDFMRSFLALALGCVLVAGCGGSGGSTSGSASTFSPTTSNGTGTGSSGATSSTSTSDRLLTTRFPVARWYNESSLAFLGQVAIACQGQESFEVAYTAGFNRVYIESQGAQNQTFVNNGVLELDGTTYSLRRTIQLGSVNTMSIAVTPDDSKLYIGVQTFPITNHSQDLVDVVDVPSGKIIKTITMSTNSRTQQMAADKSGHVYVVSDDGNGSAHATIVRINTTDDSVAYTTQLGSTYPQFFDNVAVSADQSTINFNSFSNAFAVDAASGTVLATVPLNGSPFGDDDAKTGSAFYVYTQTAPTGTLTTYDPRTLTVKHAVTVNPNLANNSVSAGSSGLIYVNREATDASWHIDAVDPATGSVVQSVPEPDGAVLVNAQ